MKHVNKILAMCAVGLLAACAHNLTDNMDSAKATDGVYDPSIASKDPVSIKDGSMVGNKVYDAGAYNPKADFTDVVERGGKNGADVPSQPFFSDDRDKIAPLNKILYVLTEENPSRCIVGKFLEVKGRKKLVVYPKTTVPSTYCIYQKNFTPEPEGFSIYLKDGGVCKPSYAVVTVDDQKRKISSVDQVNNIVSMTYCVEKTFSYGQEIAKRHGSN